MEFLILTFAVIIYGLFKSINYITETYDDYYADVLNKFIFGGILAIMPSILIILIETLKISNPELSVIFPMIKVFVDVFVFIIIGFFMFNVYQIVESIKKLYYKGKYD